MKLHKAGYSIIFKAIATYIAFNVAFYFIENRHIYISVVTATSILLFLVVNFFRSPNRIVIADDHTILAPADGKIVVIEETEENEYLKDRCLQVSIFMSIFNVHINWFPVNGLVKYSKHHNGNYAAAYLPKSSLENERTSIAIQCKNGQEILMRQVAGALATRIVTYAKAGDTADQREHAGFIKFGSRVDLFLPIGTEINVQLGQKTRGSQTVIGKLS